MMIRLPYGRGCIEARVPDTAVVVSGRKAHPLPDPEGALLQGLRAPTGCPPLARCVRPGMSVVIVHTDATRATPNSMVLPVIVDELNRAGVPDSRITLLNATGAHRAQTEGEMRALVGGPLFARVRCVQHDACDAAAHAACGATPGGNRVELDRAYLDAQFRIVTGFIEPHFFAGYSGGPKAILPGIASLGSITANHAAHLVSHQDATWGVTEGNPVWEEMAAAARLAPPDFCVNVSLDPDARVTGVFAGELFAAHAAGCAFVREHAMAGVDEAFDVTIATNSGYPLDQNLYQAVKGMSAAARVTRPGGTIIIAAACEEGLPSHGNYAALLGRYPAARDAHAALGGLSDTMPDQWQALIHARIAADFDVRIFTGGLDDASASRAWLIRTPSVEKALADALDVMKGGRVGILPDGPLVIPFLKPRN
ncbi:MAG: nickel-dependent lactate racemase [Spirochaetes bacterium]|nr:MAG: nickel-dependent lactate racemase [Spirochaetota bacterium]